MNFHHNEFDEKKKAANIFIQLRMVKPRWRKLKEVQLHLVLVWNFQKCLFLFSYYVKNTLFDS